MLYLATTSSCWKWKCCNSLNATVGTSKQQTKLALINGVSSLEGRCIFQEFIWTKTECIFPIAKNRSPKRCYCSSVSAENVWGLVPCGVFGSSWRWCVKRSMHPARQRRRLTARNMNAWPRKYFIRKQLHSMCLYGVCFGDIQSFSPCLSQLACYVKGMLQPDCKQHSLHMNRSSKHIVVKTSFQLCRGKREKNQSVSRKITNVTPAVQSVNTECSFQVPVMCGYIKYCAKTTFGNFLLHHRASWHSQLLVWQKIIKHITPGKK